VRGVSAVNGGATGNPPPPTGEPVGLYQSTDGGNTFNLIFSPITITPGGFSEGVNQVALDPSNPRIVYAAAFGLGVFRSAPFESAGAFQQVFVSLGYDPCSKTLSPAPLSLSPPRVVTPAYTSAMAAAAVALRHKPELPSGAMTT